MLDAAEAVLRFTHGVSRERYFDSHGEMMRSAVERKLEVLGEAAGDVPAAIQAQHAQIPWRSLIRFRDVLAHHYFGIQDATIWKTIEEDIPQLVQQLKSALASPGDSDF
jgi:uncharacterized protein with HEPN domain